MADALSRKANLASITKIHCDIKDAIRDGMQHDPYAKKLMELAAQGKTSVLGRRCLLSHYGLEGLCAHV